MPRLNDWAQEYPGGPWRAQCGGYLLEADEDGRSLADLEAAGEDGPSWAVRRAGLGTMGDPTAGKVAGDIADTLEAAQDMAELEVMDLLANDANVRALLVGMWMSPDQAERQNAQTLGLMESVDALKARAEAAEALLRATPIESSLLAVEVDTGGRSGPILDGLRSAREHMKPINPDTVIIVLPPGVRMINLDQSQAVAVTFSAIADALGVPERERPAGVLTAVQRAQAEWRGTREALAETRAALHNREMVAPQ